MVIRQAHNLKTAGSSPAPATMLVAPWITKVIVLKESTYPCIIPVDAQGVKINDGKMTIGKTISTKYKAFLKWYKCRKCAKFQTTAFRL